MRRKLIPAPGATPSGGVPLYGQNRQGSSFKERGSHAGRREASGESVGKIDTGGCARKEIVPVPQRCSASKPARFSGTTTTSRRSRPSISCPPRWSQFQRKIEATGPGATLGISGGSSLKGRTDTRSLAGPHDPVSTAVKRLIGQMTEVKPRGNSRNRSDPDYPRAGGENVLGSFDFFLPGISFVSGVAPTGWLLPRRPPVRRRAANKSFRAFIGFLPFSIRGRADKP